MIRFAQILKNEDGVWFLQVAAHSDMRAVSTTWQQCEELGDACWTLDVDIEACLIPCENYQHAMTMLAEHYKKELENNS